MACMPYPNHLDLVQLAILGNNLQWCPKFNNLKLLTLGTWCLDANFYGLIVFLQNSPNLEKLTLELKEVRDSLHMRILLA